MMELTDDLCAAQRICIFNKKTFFVQFNSIKNKIKFIESIFFLLFYFISNLIDFGENMFVH